VLKKLVQKEYVVILQALWRGKFQRKRYQAAKRGVVAIQSIHKMIKYKVAYQLKRQRAIDSQRYIRGYLVRLKFSARMKLLPSKCARRIQRCYKLYLKRKMIVDIMTDIKKAENKWVNIAWPKTSPQFYVASKLFLTFYKRIMAKKFRKSTKTKSGEWMVMMKFKVRTRDLFLKKSSYRTRYN
jgi:hypothetical protein